MNLLEMNHVKKSFDGQEVIQDISLTVREGEIVSIIGPVGFREIDAASLCNDVGVYGQRGTGLSGRTGGVNRG